MNKKFSKIERMIFGILVCAAMAGILGSALHLGAFDALALVFGGLFLIREMFFEALIKVQSQAADAPSSQSLRV